MKAIGFIGLGTMGAPMAAHLLRQGYNVTVYNRTASKAEALMQLGADVVPTPAEAARTAEVLFTMVSDDDAVMEVYYGEEGIFSGIKPGMVIFDCSTVSPELSRRLHRDLSGHYVEFLDAPVTGSQEAAMEGKLVFVIGGNKEVLDMHTDLILAMGIGYRYMGQAGSGTEAKLILNGIVGANMAALAEGMALAAKASIDAQAFLDLVLSSGAASRLAELKGDRVLNRNFQPQFALKHMLKDLQLAASQAARLGQPAQMLSTAEQLYRMAHSSDLGEEDLSAVVKVYEEWAGSSFIRKQGDQADAGMLQDGYPKGNRRKAVRIPLDIKLKVSIYQWEAEGAFSGQSLEASLYDLSESGMQIICDIPLAVDMFVVIHFPQEAELPPITSKIIRIERHGETFHYGCLISGMAPYTRKKLESYITKHLESIKQKP